MGLYTHAKSVVDPDSQQLLVTEGWTSQNNLGGGKVKEGCMEEQVYLASSE